MEKVNCLQNRERPKSCGVKLGNKSYICIVCGELYLDSTFYDRHLRIAHNHTYRDIKKENEP